MKIAIVSDTHFGYGWESERSNDSFDNAREAFRRTVDADLVILPGDIYDHKVPKQEVLGRSIDCFNEYRDGACNLVFAEESDVEYEFTGTPLVAIHGTHERRSRGFMNPIELLDKMGYLLHLHNEKAVFEHAETGEKVAVHGMSGVPERYAPGVLEKYDPQPVDDAYNIFMFHQSVEKFVYTSKDHAALTLEHLPDGFDLLVDGHIHWYDLSNIGKDKPLILPGSTISTQMRKIEAEKPKGYVTVDTETGDVTFHELETPRDQYYEEIVVDDMSSSEIMQVVDQTMEKILDNDTVKRPLVRIVLSGKTDATVKLADIRKQYRDDVVLSVSKTFKTSSQTASPDTFKESTKSVAERGKDLLQSKVDGDGMHVENLFELLAEEQLDAAVDFVEDLELPADEPDDATEATKDTETVQTDADSADTGPSTEVDQETAETMQTVDTVYGTDEADDSEESDSQLINSGDRTLSDFS